MYHQPAFATPRPTSPGYRTPHPAASTYRAPYPAVHVVPPARRPDWQVPVIILAICGLLGVLGVGGVLLWAGVTADPPADRPARPPAVAPAYPGSPGAPPGTPDLSGLDVRLTDKTPCYTSSCLINMELVNNGVRRADGMVNVKANGQVVARRAFTCDPGERMTFSFVMDNPFEATGGRGTVRFTATYSPAE
ncbi:hypothetical protein GCM10023321_21880 [Pseudonocardia eucalypti]|uniref:DUF3426 domain-containing protein n=1 Tax=Pseudonocardia eucalypti TaxID=648755 RepID=A0ABP9PZD4_9PSEU|nr:hypothetical protein [Pseudonocardia eucalypti]